MEKLGTFVLGMVAGAVTLGATALVCALSEDEDERENSKDIKANDADNTEDKKGEVISG